MTEHWIDAVIVAVYLVGSFVIGMVASKYLNKGDSSEDGYFLAGRRLPGWLNGFSQAATTMNADVAPFYCGMAIAVGLPMAWFYMSRVGLALALIAMLFAVRWRQLGVRTSPEFFTIRFGGRPARFVRVYFSIYTV